MCIYCCFCDEYPAQLCAAPVFAPVSSGSSPGCHGGKVNHGVLLYFSPWRSPSATSGGDGKTACGCLPMWKRLVFPYKRLLHVNVDLPTAPQDETGRPRWRRRKKPQAQCECLRDLVKACVPPASPKVPPTSMPSTFDKTRLQHTPHLYGTGCLLSPFTQLLPESRCWGLEDPLA